MQKINILTGNNSQYSVSMLQKILNSCYNTETTPKDIIISNYTPLQTNVIITFGEETLKLFSDEKLSDVRGTIIQGKDGRKIIPTLDLKQLTIDPSLTFIVKLDILKAFKEKDFPHINIPSWILHDNPTFTECISYLDKLINLPESDYVAFDIETNKNQQIICLGFAHSSTEGISIPFEKGGISCWNTEEEITLWTKISEFFISPVKKVAHNACFDVASLWQNNKIQVNNLYFDTMLAWHVILLPSGDTLGIKKNLGFISSLILNMPAWKHKSHENLAIYNIKDCCATWALVDPLLKKMVSSDLMKTFNLEMSEIEPACYLSLRGIKIDISQKGKIHENLKNLLESEKVKFSSLLKEKYNINEAININSPSQLKNLLYIILKLPIKTIRGTDKITTNDAALNNLYRQTKNEILKCIIDYKKITKLLSFCDFKVSKEGKVHTSYNIAGTSSGRWSSSKSIILPYGSGNLQQVPSQDTGSIIRSMYIPSSENENTWIVQADFVQAEAKIVAYLIEDTALKEAFKQNKDIHKITASLMFDVSYDEVTPQMRIVGKTIRHAINYSLGYNALADLLECEVKIAKGYLQTFHSICPNLRRWQSQIQTQLQINRTLVTPLGRKKVFQGRFDDTMYRSAYSFIPQSTIGDLLNISLVKFYNLYGNEYSLLLQLHDAMYVDDVEESRIQDCISKMQLCMKHELLIQGEICIVDVDFKKGKNWKEMFKIELDK